MDMREKFNELMEQQTEIALATSVDNQPNVRIVSFLYDEKTKKIYFSTFKEGEKTKEIQKNNQIALTTVPQNDTAEHVRIQKGTIKKSEQTIADFAEQWIQKIPSYKENIEYRSEYLQMYEISFEAATVIVDMERKEQLIFR